MKQDNLVVDFRVHFNQDTGRLEVSILSESEPNAAMTALAEVFRVRGNEDQNPLKDVQVESVKIDPESMKQDNRLRPMWDKTTCDIIK